MTKKSVIIKTAITLIVLAVCYAMFWFFKVGQLEKRITRFIGDNNVYLSSGEISVKGFPLSQNVTIKDLKFRIPNKILSKNQVIVKEFKAQSSIFSNNFTVSLGNEITLEDENGNLLPISFNQQPKISISLNKSKSVTLDYQDSGYQILDLNKENLYSAQSSVVKIIASPQSDGKISVKVSTSIKEINGYDIVDLYKNLLEQSIIKGIETEKIKIGSSFSNVANPTINQNELSLEIPNATTENLQSNLVVEANKIEATNNTQQSQDIQASNNEPASEIAQDSTNIAPAIIGNADQNSQPNTADNTIKDIENLVQMIPASEIRSSLVMDIEYILIPNKDKQSQQTEFDPMKIQDLPMQYSKDVKVNSIIFANAAYTLNISGSLSFVQDDSMPFGSLAIRVEQLDNLLKYFKEYLSTTLKYKGYDTAESLSSEILPQLANTQLQNPNDTTVTAEQLNATSAIAKPAQPNVATPNEVSDKNKIAVTAENSAPSNMVAENKNAQQNQVNNEVVSNQEQLVQNQINNALEVQTMESKPQQQVMLDPYDNFLKEIHNRIDFVLKELALKNPNSNPGIAEFNLTRQKNLEFLVNDTPISEILGKF